MKIRKAETKDAIRITEIRQKSWEKAYLDILPKYIFHNFDFDSELQKKKQQLKQNDFYVIEDNNFVVGYFTMKAIIDNDKVPNKDIDGEIGSIYMSPDYYSKGFGSACFEFARTNFKKLGYRNFIVWCLAENNMGRAFYEKQNGILVARRKSYIKETEVEEVAYEFILE